MSDILERFEGRKTRAQILDIEIDGLILKIPRISQREISLSRRRAKSALREEGLDVESLDVKHLTIAAAQELGLILAPYVNGWERVDGEKFEFSKVSCQELFDELTDIELATIGLNYFTAYADDKAPEGKEKKKPKPKR